MFHFDANVKSHMPFAAPDPAHDFQPREFCCIMIDEKWKIHQFVNLSWVRVNTGLPEDATECSPAAECINGVWHLTFIAGGAESSRLFRLYHICDLDNHTAAIPVCPADVGFIQKNRLVYADRHGLVTIESPGNTMSFQFTDVEFLYRVTYDPFDPNRLLISGMLNNGDVFSRIYNFMTGDLWSLVADGVAAYKAVFWRDQCFYALRAGSQFEDRKIVQAERVRVTLLDANDLVTITSASNDRVAANNDQEFE